MPSKNAVDSAWINLLNQTKVLFTNDLDQFPWNLIPATGDTPEAGEAAIESESLDRCAIQITQSILLVVAICNEDSRFESQEVQSWLTRVSQPTCRRVFEFVFGSGDPRAETLLQTARDLSRQLLEEQTKSKAIDTTEFVLSLTSPGTRRSKGAYFTPSSVARFVIQRIDHALRQSQQFASGLVANISNKEVDQRCNIFDPSVGSGIFLVEAIRFAIKHVEESERNEWLATNMLPRIFGCDILLPSLISTHLNIAKLLLDCEFDFSSTDNNISRLNLVLANSLADLETSDSDPEQTLAYTILRATPMHAIVGNPPFSSRSTNDGSWIRGLVAGNRESESVDKVNYITIDGQRLGERKIWLHDDYVKFFRYSQWLVSKSQVGVIGFISNRGFINNVTFRGMRYQLQKAFDSIDVIDLKGDTRNRSDANSGSQNIDENIFPIETGVGIFVLATSDKTVTDSTIRYASLNGSANYKIAQLKASLAEGQFKSLAPTSPNYFFDPRDDLRSAEYATGLPISEAMPASWSAPVTARDSFVVDFSREALTARIAKFCDSSQSNEAIREEFFSRTRSSRYPRGDSRSWKLSDARIAVAAEDHDAAIRDILYRPFDRRWIYWSPKMIDWPRTGLAEVFEIPGNVALIARRQSPPQSEPNFFFATNQLTLDGILRSDNRGNETIFPLFVRDALNPMFVRANFSRETIDFVCEKWQDNFFDFTSEPIAIENAATELVGARNLFNYIYAVFYSSQFRERFAEQICIDFPRVHFCRDTALARRLAHAGERLIDIHLQSYTTDESPNVLQIKPGYPKYARQSIRIDPETTIANVSSEVWNYRFGKHQVARKWLKDRKPIGVSQNCLANYRCVLGRIADTIEIRSEIETLICSAGGWNDAF